MRLAETSAWGSAVVFLLAIAAGSIPAEARFRGVLLLVALGLWIAATFHFVLPRRPADVVAAAASVGGGIVFAALAYWLLAHYDVFVGLLFVPVVLCAGLLGGLRAGAAAAAAATVASLAVSGIMGLWRGPDQAIFVSGLFALVGLVAGSVSQELRSHFRAEQEEHRFAVAVRHRLSSVLDAVEEAIIFSDRQGTVRLINRRAEQLFELDEDEATGQPVVQLLRALARQTEDPEGFMEIFQALRDDPELEIRELIEQIIPARRKMRMFSAPAFDDDGALIGRIDVFTDISEAVARSAEVRRLLEEARHVAESYQRSLLPESIPSLPRVSLLAHYVSAAGRRAVCGDFYDFVPLANGRIAVVLGDVCGFGPGAANDAALSRYTLRSFASEISGPGRLMQWMNRYLANELHTDRFVRLVLVDLDPERASIEYVNAGHVPPVLYRFRTGEVEFLSEGGLVLGVSSEEEFKPASVALEPGDMLVLYTDGVTEAPREGQPFGQGRLKDLISHYGVGTPGEMIQGIRRSVNAWVEEGELRDDLCMIVFQVVPDDLIGEPIRELVIPNDPSRLNEMRAFVASFLADVRASVEPSSEFLLAVGEATANATRHGRTDDRSEARIRCSLDGEVVTVEVTDDGPGFELTDELKRGPLDRYASGGRGIYLMGEFADEFEAHATSEGTTVILRKRLWPSPTHPQRL